MKAIFGACSLQSFRFESTVPGTLDGFAVARGGAAVILLEVINEC